MRSVWVVESGEYSQRFINLVASSLESAVAALRSRYGLPDTVWDDPVREDPYVFTVTGHFQHHVGISTKHDCEFSIELYEVL